MDYKKKLQLRLYFAIGYLVLGLAMIVIFNVLRAENDIWSSFGFAMVIIGVAKIRNYMMINKSEETLKRQQIAETDERNISIANRAKSIALTVYIVLACVSVIILHIVNQSQLATVISGTVCALLLIYWITYWVIYRRS